VVFEQPETTILSGHVEGDGIDVLQPHLSVEIRSAVDPSRIVSVVPVPLSYYFEVRNLPKGKHLVQLRSGLPSHTHIFESELVEVDLEKQPQIHVGPVKYKTEERHHKQVTPFRLASTLQHNAVVFFFCSCTGEEVRIEMGCLKPFS
jgi:hypothetical protein